MKIKARKGDTFRKYSEWFQLPVQLLIDSNPHIRQEPILEGTEVAICGYDIEDYQAQPNDSVESISLLKKCSVEAILRCNPLLKEKQCETGQIIRLPRKVMKTKIRTDRPYDFRQLQIDLVQLLELYPFLKCRTIGYSVLKKPIYEITVGRGTNIVHYNAAFHANEWITSLILMKCLNEYLISLTLQQTFYGTNPLNLYMKNFLSVVPMVNPDGVDLVIHGADFQSEEIVLPINEGNKDFTHWKANIRGVDLNNQFPANWEIEKERKIPKHPAPRDYPGEQPLTEPEAITMAALAKEKKFDRLMCFHTQGKEIYWGYDNFEPKESYEIAREFEKVSGYKAIQYIDSHAGYKDWFIQNFQKPGFTVELGKGINPLPLSFVPSIYEEAVCLFMKNMFH